jgi:hypothetical protein
VGTFHVFVTAAPIGLVDGTRNIDFHLRDTVTGEEANYRSAFMGPAITGRR